MDLKEKLLSRIEKNENGCWEWQGAIRGNSGYGAIKIKGKSYSTHRISYEVFKGNIPEGLLVCHTCDNRKCINPEHLWLGTHKDNMQDAIKKNRVIHNSENIKRYQFKEGDKPPNRIITEEKAREIKEFMDINYPDIVSLVLISRYFDVPHQLLRDMRRRKKRSYMND